MQGLNFLRMSARVDGVASRVQSAIQMRQVGVIKPQCTCTCTAKVTVLGLSVCLFVYHCYSSNDGE